jgi:hypothetical protein
MPLVLEGIVTTLHADGSPNITPMGPIVDSDFSQLILRPYKSSTTYRNLLRAREGVFHVTDDVELLARAAVNQLNVIPPLRPAHVVAGVIVADACRWYEFRIMSCDDSRERAQLECAVVHQGRIRDFFGFNRAKHAVVEAAILATRISFLPAEYIAAEFERLQSMVDKTAGESERRAFEFLAHYAKAQLPEITR